MKRFGGLQNKSAIVTGAASGIGAAITRLFHEEGAKVLAIDLDEKRLKEAHDGLENVYAFCVDLTSDRAVGAVMHEVEHRLDGLNIVCNNAGIVGEVGPLEKLPESEWRRVLNINLSAIFNLTQACIPLIRIGGSGRIINTGSVNSFQGSCGGGVYVVSKHAVLGFTRNLALELAQDGITVNAVLPGFTSTGITGTMEKMEEGYTATYSAKIPLGRFAYPKEIAAAVLFLASEEASYVTGHGLVVDGGLTAGF